MPEARGFHCESGTLGKSTSPGTFEANYTHYRARWDDILIPAEDSYAASLRKMPLRRAVIFGTGRAGVGLFEALHRAGIETAAFTTTGTVARGTTCCGLPVLPLERVLSVEFDRLIAGSQFFYQVERQLSSSDPSGNALLPMIPLQDRRPC
jgi:hypothetical protein